MTLKSIAESGMFTLSDPTITPIRSAELAPLYEAFMYLAATKAENQYIAAISKPQ